MSQEEDDYIRGPGETDEELCPNPKCNSNLLKPVMFGRQRPMRCATCGTYLCPKCLSILKETALPAGTVLQCPKGHVV